jgi:N-acetyl-anhydromuramyl-L-alanine amidase AmpD
LGYHFVIDNGTSGTHPGQVETGDRWYKQLSGAHCNAMNMNEFGIGICLVGNFDRENVTEEQLQSAAWLVKSLQWRYGIPTSRVIRHQDVKGKETDCPGKRFPWQNFQHLLS